MQLDWMEAEWKLLSGCFLRSHFQDIGSKQFLAYKTEWNNTWKRGREKEKNRRKKERKGIIKWWIEKNGCKDTRFFLFSFSDSDRRFFQSENGPFPQYQVIHAHCKIFKTMQKEERRKVTNNHPFIFYLHVYTSRFFLCIFTHSFLI